MTGREQDPTVVHPTVTAWREPITSSSAAAARTEIISIPPAVPDLSWMPARDVAPEPVPRRGRRARHQGLLRGVVNAASLGLLVGAAFLGGQWTTQNGVEPVLPMPIGDVQTAAQTARLWALGTPAEQAQQCGWLATPGETRDYVLGEWVRHLGRPEGGRLDEVDPAVVARVLDDTCAGRPHGKG